MKNNVVLNKSFAFAVKIVKLVKSIQDQKKEYLITKQLIRSGTSIGANIREGNNAESKADFIHKLKIASKKADETEYWLLLCKNSKSYPGNESLLPLLEEIQKLLSSIISSAKKNN